jgi:sugar O-acyltransferase (sialic acid O-acetyltransferase NeuD family)
MTTIVVIGSGGLAADVTCGFDGISTGKYNDITIKGYIDYEENIQKYWSRYHFEKPVLADIDNYKIEGDEYFVVGVADIKFRKRMIEKVLEKGGRFINLIHPTAIIDRHSIIGTGNIVSPYCIIGPNVHLGDFNVMTSQTIVGHDCVVGNNNFLATTSLCGHVTIGDDNYFGIRATVLPYVSAGCRNIVQAGFLLDKDISDGNVVFQRLKKNYSTPTKPL